MGISQPRKNHKRYQILAFVIDFSYSQGRSPAETFGAMSGVKCQVRATPIYFFLVLLINFSNMQKRYSLEELLKKSGTRKAVFVFKFTNLFNLYKLKCQQQQWELDKRVGSVNINSNFIQSSKKADWDYLMTLNQLSVHLTLQLFWQIGIDFLAKLIKKFIFSTWHNNIPLGVETNVVVNYIHILRENLNKSVVFRIVCDNYHNCLDSLSKLKARYCLYYQAKFNIFCFGSVTKFLNSRFLPLKIPELPDSIVYKINIALFESIY